MADKSDPQRLVDLTAALKASKPKAVLSLADCAALWGVTKPRFVNKRAEFANWPEPILDGNRHDFPARAAIKSMLGYLERHQQAATARVNQQARLLGGRPGMAELLTQHSPAELALLNRLDADTQQREIQQKLYIPVADVQRTAGEIFSEISDFMSQLSNLIDPHGKLEPSVRALIDSKAHERLLALHSRMKAMLADDAPDPRNREPAAKPVRTPVRRKRAKRMVKPAR